MKLWNKDLKRHSTQTQVFTHLFLPSSHLSPFLISLFYRLSVPLHPSHHCQFPIPLPWVWKQVVHLTDRIFIKIVTYRIIVQNIKINTKCGGFRKQKQESRKKGKEIVPGSDSYLKVTHKSLRNSKGNSLPEQPTCAIIWWERWMAVSSRYSSPLAI